MSPALATKPDTQQLEEAFQLFNQLSSQLAQSYEQLKQQVEVLNHELSETRHQHILELKDKERLANRLYRVMQAMPAAVIVKDEKDRIDQFNPVAEELFPGICWGRLWQEVFSDHALNQTANNEWLLKDGRQVSVSVKSLKPDPGEILVIIDVSDSRALQKQLNRQERLAAMGEMAAHLAHQIRTPIASAMLYSDHLSRSDLSNEKRKVFSQRLKSNLEHTENQVSDMLSFARGGHYQPESVNLSRLTAGLEETLGPQIRAMGCALVVQDQTDGQAIILGNRDSLTGALSNLVENAVRHGGEVVTVTLTLMPVDDGYCIRVEDDGCGISEEIAERIFDPFFTTSSDGTGLGLAVVQNVILAHGGAVQLVELPEKGAGFVLCLPSYATLESQKMPEGEKV